MVPEQVCVELFRYEWGLSSQNSLVQLVVPQQACEELFQYEMCLRSQNVLVLLVVPQQACEELFPILRIIWFCCFYIGVMESCLQQAVSLVTRLSYSSMMGIWRAVCKEQHLLDQDYLVILLWICGELSAKSRVPSIRPSFCSWNLKSV